MDDRTVLALVLLFGVSLIVWAAFCAALLVLIRGAIATAHAAGRLAHTAWEQVAVWVLVVATQAGPMDTDPDTFAARTAELPPLYSDPTTTPGGTTHA